MEDKNFKEFFQRAVNCCVLASDAAAELLQRILAILKNTENVPSRREAQGELPAEQTKEEEML